MGVSLSDLPPRAREQALAKLAASDARRKPAKRPKATDGRSDLEASLLGQIRMAGLPAPVEQFRFAPPRKWRFDGAYPDRMIAYEIDGATHSGGRHVRGSGVEVDCLKMSTAAMLGFRVMRFTGRMVEDGTALALVRAILEQP